MTTQTGAKQMTNNKDALKDLSIENILKYIFAAFESNQQKTQEDFECKGPIRHDLFHLYLLIPATMVTLLLAFTMRRKYSCLGFLDGRPGLIVPMDTFGKTNRFSYAAAWGCFAFLTADIIFKRKYAVEPSGPRYFREFYTLLSMCIYGLDYLPLFAALSVDCVFGYIVGTLYVWLLTAMMVFQDLACTLPEAPIEVIIQFVRFLPPLLCKLYLCISFPVRLLQSFRKKKKFFSSMQKATVFEQKKSVHDSWEGKHVVQILRPPTSEPVPPETVKGKTFKGLVNSLLYHRHPDFRYSARLLSVMLVGGMTVYKASFEIFDLALRVSDDLEQGLMSLLEYIGNDEEKGESPDITTTRQYIYLLRYILFALKGSILASVSLAALIGILLILHMLSSYRTNLLDLYKGNTSHIPPRTEMSNPSMLVSSMKYAGYQVGYIAWGFIVQFLVYFLISVVLAAIISFIMAGYHQWLLDTLMQMWPVLLAALVFHLLQVMLAKYVFLQECGNALRLNNRRLLFTVTYFLFFYNIFIGLVSCLMRIIKSMIIGAAFISRLDQSVIPQMFQTSDPGFNAYVGFMHVEMAHTHPVVIVFLRLLADDVGITKQYQHPSNESNIESIGLTTDVPKKKSFLRARNNWQTMYTLHNNFSIRQYRKYQMDHAKMNMTRRIKMAAQEKKRCCQI